MLKKMRERDIDDEAGADAHDFLLDEINNEGAIVWEGCRALCRYRGRHPRRIRRQKRRTFRLSTGVMRRKNEKGSNRRGYRARLEKTWAEAFEGSDAGDVPGGIISRAVDSVLVPYLANVRSAGT